MTTSNSDLFVLNPIHQTNGVLSRDWRHPRCISSSVILNPMAGELTTAEVLVLAKKIYFITMHHFLPSCIDNKCPQFEGGQKVNFITLQQSTQLLYQRGWVQCCLTSIMTQEPAF